MKIIIIKIIIITIIIIIMIIVSPHLWKKRVQGENILVQGVGHLATGQALNWREGNYK